MILLLMLLVCLTVPAWAGPGPNAPAGITLITENDFTSFSGVPSMQQVPNQGNGWFNVYANSDCYMVTDQSAPSSDKKVIRQHKNAGASHGTCGIFNESIGSQPRLYGKMVFKHSNPFYWVNSGGYKLSGYLSQEGQGGNYFRPFEMKRGSSMTPNGSGWSVMAGANNAFSGQADNCRFKGNSNFFNPRADECALVYGFYANTGAQYSTAAGVWHTMEFIAQLGTCAGCYDGVHILYLDNVKISDWRLNYVMGNFIAWKISMTLDGQDVECLSCESWIDIDYVGLWKYPAGTAFSNGGGVVPPPDLPPPPVGPITDITLTVQ